jgi:hypothetical protein
MPTEKKENKFEAEKAGFLSGRLTMCRHKRVQLLKIMASIDFSAPYIFM